MGIDININLDLTKVLVGKAVPDFRSLGIVYNSNDCVAWLKQQKSLIGWTYSFTPYGLSLYNFTRLIAGVCNGQHVNSCRVRYANNIHAKCYLSDKSALIGSFNLTAPTIQDLAVVIVHKQTLQHLRREFNRQWKALA